MQFNSLQMSTPILQGNHAPSSLNPNAPIDQCESRNRNILLLRNDSSQVSFSNQQIPRYLWDYSETHDRERRLLSISPFEDDEEDSLFRVVSPIFSGASSTSSSPFLALSDDESMTLPENHEGSISSMSSQSFHLSKANTYPISHSSKAALGKSNLTIEPNSPPLETFSLTRKSLRKRKKSSILRRKQEDLKANEDEKVKRKKFNTRHEAISIEEEETPPLTEVKKKKRSALNNKKDNRVCKSTEVELLLKLIRHLQQENEKLIKSLLNNKKDNRVCKSAEVEFLLKLIRHLQQENEKLIKSLFDSLNKQ